MEKEELIDRLKTRLRSTSFDAPAVETVQPEIRTAAQYAATASMRAGFLLDDDDSESAV